MLEAGEFLANMATPSFFRLRSVTHVFFFYQEIASSYSQFISLSLQFQAADLHLSHWYSPFCFIGWRVLLPLLRTLEFSTPGIPLFGAIRVQQIQCKTEPCWHYQGGLWRLLNVVLVLTFESVDKIKSLFMERQFIWNLLSAFFGCLKLFVF